MDYKRIYAAFINARRAKESSLTGYVERHHIIPRSLGGGDEAENMIALTPEDHYFAHLLLAKVHGGTQWRALHAMAHLTKESTKGRNKLKLRFVFGHVRRSLAAHYSKFASGQNGHNADKVFYEVRHVDGRVMLGRRFYLAKRTGVKRKQISALLRGTKKLVHGWYSPHHNPNGLNKSEQLSLKLQNHNVYTLYHFDGRVWSGTLGKFRKMTGRQLTWQGERHKQIVGWYATKEEAGRHEQRISNKAKIISDARGDISGSGNPRYDPTLYEFFNHQTKEHRQCTRHDLCVSAGIGYGDMGAVLTRKRQSAKDWTLWDRREEKFRRPMGYRDRSATLIGANATSVFQKESLSATL